MALTLRRIRFGFWYITKHPLALGNKLAEQPGCCYFIMKTCVTRESGSISLNDIVVQHKIGRLEGGGGRAPQGNPPNTKIQTK
jgi:hypothetical protein